jgi:hypothetical protein
VSVQDVAVQLLPEEATAFVHDPGVTNGIELVTVGHVLSVQSFARVAGSGVQVPAPTLVLFAVQILAT